jgi:NADH-quinone oxidoreductase subunit N
MYILLNKIISNIVINKLILPEAMLSILCCFALMLDLFIVHRYKIITYLLIQVGLIGIMLMIFDNFAELSNQQSIQEQSIFLIQNGFSLNTRSNILKLTIVVITFFIFVYAKNHFERISKPANKKFKIEYYVLSLISLLGSMLLISSHNLFNVYFAIEIIFLPICALIIIQSNDYNQRVSLEAGIKYFVLSVIFSGILLYGLSLIYGAVGSLDFKVIFDFIQNQHISLLFHIGIGLVFVGVFFKMGVFPFQIWVPDVFQGSNSIVVMLVASLPKIAMISLLGNFLLEVLPTYLSRYNWQTLLVFIGITSMFIGNVGALLQNNIKRLLGYSSIANMGFMLLGLATNDYNGILAVNFYVALYSLIITSILGFFIILSNQQINYEEISDLSGLSKKHPWISGMLLILLLSMSGLPPTAGFYAKFSIINNLISHQWFLSAITALLLSLVGLTYCLKIIKEIYFPANFDNLLVNKFRYGNYFAIIMLSISSMANLLYFFVMFYLRNNLQIPVIFK